MDGQALTPARVRRIVRDLAQYGDPARTLHVVGDIHFGWTLADRLAIAATDFDRMTRADLYTRRFYAGDLTEESTGPQDAAALSWIAARNPDHEWDTVAGNHDEDGRDAETFMAAYGYSGDELSGCWVRDLPFVRIIGLSPPEITDPAKPETLDSTVLTFLANAADAVQTDCVVLMHAPLMNTVLGNGFNSTVVFFSAQDDAAIRAVLADRPNIRAWISGHTHSDLSFTDIVKREPVGTRTIATINASAIAYTGFKPGTYAESDDDPIRSPLVTVLPDRIEVRWRDHRTGALVPLNGQTVTTVLYAVEAATAAGDTGETVRNINPYPSFEAAGGPWVANEASAVTVTRTTAAKRSGQYGARVVAGASPIALSGPRHAGIAATAGTVHSYGYWVRHAMAAAKPFTVRIAWLAADGSLINAQTGPTTSVPNTNAWTRVAWEGRSVLTGASFVAVGLYRTDVPTTGESWDIDDIVIVEAAQLPATAIPEYNDDGALKPFYSWEGTANASPAVRSITLASIQSQLDELRAQLEALA